MSLWPTILLCVFAIVDAAITNGYAIDKPGVSAGPLWFVDSRRGTTDASISAYTGTTLFQGFQSPISSDTGARLDSGIYRLVDNSPLGSIAWGESSSPADVLLNDVLDTSNIQTPAPPGRPVSDLYKAGMSITSPSDGGALVFVPNTASSQLAIGIVGGIAYTRVLPGEFRMRLLNKMNQRITGLEVRYTFECWNVNSNSANYAQNTTIQFGYTHSYAETWYWNDITPALYTPEAGYASGDYSDCVLPASHHITDIMWNADEHFFLRWKMTCPNCGTTQNKYGDPVRFTYLEIIPYVVEPNDYAYEMKSTGNQFVTSPPYPLATGFTAPFTFEAWIRPEQTQFGAALEDLSIDLATDNGDMTLFYAQYATRALSVRMRWYSAFADFVTSNGAPGSMATPAHYNNPQSWHLVWANGVDLTPGGHATDTLAPNVAVAPSCGSADTTTGCGTPGTAACIYPGRWTHVAVTFDPTTGKVEFHTNGCKRSEENVGTLAPALGAINTFSVGKDMRGSSRMFVGLVDELRVWNSKRSITEIRYNMDNDVQTETVKPDLYFTFNDMTTTAAVIPSKGAAATAYQGNINSWMSPYSKHSPLTLQPLTGGTLYCLEDATVPGGEIVCNATLKTQSGACRSPSWSSEQISIKVLKGPGSVSGLMTHAPNPSGCWSITFKFLADARLTGTSYLRGYSGNDPMGNIVTLITYSEVCKGCEYRYSKGPNCAYTNSQSDASSYLLNQTFHTINTPACVDDEHDDPYNCCNHWYSCKLGTRRFMRKNIQLQGGMCPM